MKTTRKVASILLTLAMILTLLPAAAIPARASSIVEWSRLCYDMKNRTEHKLECDAVCDNNDMLFVHNQKLVVPAGKSFTLDLNGYTLDYGLSAPPPDGIEGSVIQVYGELTIIDTSVEKTGRITGGYGRGSYGGGITVYSGGKLTLEGGSIESNSASIDGGGVRLMSESSNAATFVMNGGSIKGNRAESTLTGTKRGGGVYVDPGGVFTMNGGSIESNSASGGGGVNNSGTFTMNGGSIKSNSASDAGGGVLGSITMNGGSIAGNSASNGGGVCGSITMNGGSITQNTATTDGGGGVYVVYDGTCIITDGSIKNNTATTGDGGGVLTFYPTTVSILGGSITQNTATAGANDISYTPESIPTVTFNGNNATGGTMEPQTLTSGVGTLNANAFTRTNYEFIGWNTVADGSGYSAADGASVVLSGDLTLYAQWTNGYFVHFDANGGVGNMDDQELSLGTAGNLTACAFTRGGYHFAGWNTVQNPTEQTPGTSYANSASVTDLTTTVGETVTLYAQWTRITYTVNITPGANMTKTTASGAASQTVNAGSAMTAVVYEANDGYYFPYHYSSADTTTGVTVTRDSYTQITVSGAPTANTAITLADVSAKEARPAPTTPSATNCTTPANNDGKLTGVTILMEYKKSDATSWTDGTDSDITGLTPGLYYVRMKATDTKLASNNQELTIAAYAAPGQVAAPTFSPAAGTYTGSVDVTISTTTGGASVYYIANDTTPVLYSGAIPITATTTIKAYAEKDGMTRSPETTGTFTITAQTYAVTVNSGTGGGNYAAGASVTITADAAPSGQRFKEWTGANGLTFTSGNATTAAATFTMPARDVALTATYKSTSSGRSSGASGSSGATTTTTTNADGSTARTTTNPDGSKTAVTTTKDGSVSTVKIDKNGNLVSAEAAPSAKAISDAAAKGEPVTLPVTVKAASESKSAPPITITLPANSGRVTVEIPVENLAAGTVAYLVKANGTEEIVKTSTTGEDGVVLTLSGSATFKIADNTKTFTDVSGDEWFANNVAWATSHEIMNGVGDGNFDADAETTQGMMEQILYNLDGNALVAPAEGEAWWTAADNWAASGVTSGLGDAHDPSAPATRETDILMMYNYAQSKGYDTSARADLSSFADADGVSDWAKDAMAWAVAAGIINGSTDENGNAVLDAQGVATRAQVAAIIERFCEKVAK